MRIVSVNLQAPECVIEDACQTAWGLLLAHRQAVAPGSELGWLSTAATREVLRLLRRDRVAASLAEVAAPVHLSDYRAGESSPEQTLELRERLAEIRRLPIRQQRVVLLHGFGYEYEEIALRSPAKVDPANRGPSTDPSPAAPGRGSSDEA